MKISTNFAWLSLKKIQLRKWSQYKLIQKAQPNKENHRFSVLRGTWKSHERQSFKKDNKLRRKNRPNSQFWKSRPSWSLKHSRWICWSKSYLDSSMLPDSEIYVSKVVILLEIITLMMYNAVPYEINVNKIFLLSWLATREKAERKKQRKQQGYI